MATVAEMILRNANIITMDPSFPLAPAVAISGQKVMAVGSTAEVMVLAGPGTKVFDCGGWTVVPGFNDAHLHLFSMLRKTLSIDVSPSSVRSIAEIKELLRRQATTLPPGKWLSGTDYNEFYLAEKRCPTRWDLDEAVPDHPVVLSHRSLHACVLNSLALSLAGIGRDTPEPPGARIERDLSTGEPNGILVNMLGHIRQVMPPFTDEELEDGFRLVNRELVSRGVTSVQDATYKNDMERWRLLRRFADSGRLRPRLTVMPGPQTRLAFQEAGMTTGSGDERLRLGAVKFLLELTPDEEELKSQALDCHRSGWQLTFHAVASQTVAAVVRALEYVDARAGIGGRRHRIEHCVECPPHLLDRLKKLGLTIVTQPANIYYSGERYLATIGREEIRWLYRLKSMLAAGLTVAGSSDAPVTPPNPLDGIMAAVTRRAENGQLVRPEEAVTVFQALEMFTVNAARASFEENIKGSITPGKLADMIVLSHDLTRVPPEQIKDIEIVMTIIGGEVVWAK